MKKKQAWKDLPLFCEGIENEITTLLIETCNSVENLPRGEIYRALLSFHNFMYSEILYVVKYKKRFQTKFCKKNINF